MADQKSEKRITFTFVLLAVYLLALIWLILFKLQLSLPHMDEGRIINLIPLRGSFGDAGATRFSEIRVNILAFIPLGIYISMLKAPRSFAKDFRDFRDGIYI